MLRRSATGILALVILFLSLTGAATGVWICEGRPCGTALWTCCCSAPAGSRDARCGKPTDTGESALCRAECGCVMVIASATPATGAAATVSPTFPVAALIPAPMALPVAPALAEPVAYSVETRGPPRPSAARPHPSLRAPPLA